MFFILRNNLIIIFYSQQHMYMVWHQAPGKGFGNGINIFIVQMQKIAVIIMGGEQINAIYTTIIYVVVVAGFNGLYFSHS
jgi:hypothetical protein